MGSSSSKLKKYLYNGDEAAALHVYNTSKELQRGFEPNSSYGERYRHDTAVHLAARHAMKSVLRLFLDDLGGNPNKRNARNETALHCVCQVHNNSEGKSEALRREECLKLILQWAGPKFEHGSCEKADVTLADQMGNTALHYAAECGLLSCVKILVEYGSPLFVENNANATPCDLAEKANRSAIADYLESKMIFFDEGNEEPSPPSIENTNIDEEYQGLRPQDLQEAKDSLIVETSDMLRVPLFTAEALLRNHEWSREVLLESWMQDPVACCEKCGVVPPDDLHDIQRNEFNLEVTSELRLVAEAACMICFTNMASSEEVIPMVCEHTCCKLCWQEYLHTKIKDGSAHNIVCPAYSCHRLVPVALIEKVVSSTMSRRYLQLDIEAFVESNPDMSWCPHPGCGLAVQRPVDARRGSVSSYTHRKTTSTQQAMCSNGHTFCWGCMCEPHAPATCQQYKQWLAKIIQVKKEELEDVTVKSEVAANTFWMISNSKKCPSCKSPIEKNEGCNHMRCSKCKHDFCWVCLEPWKKHNSTTGGFFRCTRYEVVEKVDEQFKSELADAGDKHKAFQELSRFVHYYSRYENHKHSLELEKPVLDRAKLKMAQFQTVAKGSLAVRSQTATQFVEEAITALLKARLVLQHSYVFGYYLEENGNKRMLFELSQTELEERTEYLSEVIARPYLRTPRAQIIKISKEVVEKTQEFLSAISQGLSIPELSDAADTAKSRGRSNSFAAALLASDSDDSADEEPQHSRTCKAPGCSKPKIRTSGKSERHHDYCSVACLKADLSRAHQNKTSMHMDLLQALELSRLQLLQDMDSLNTTGSSSECDSGEDIARPGQAMSRDADPILEHVLKLSHNSYTEEQDVDLSLAIELSLQSPDVQDEMLAAYCISRQARAKSEHTPSQQPAEHGSSILSNRRTLQISQSRLSQESVGHLDYPDTHSWSDWAARMTVHVRGSPLHPAATAQNPSNILSGPSAVTEHEQEARLRGAVAELDDALANLLEDNHPPSSSSSESDL